MGLDGDPCFYVVYFWRLKVLTHIYENASALRALMIAIGFSCNRAKGAAKLWSRHKLCMWSNFSGLFKDLPAHKASVLYVNINYRHEWLTQSSRGMADTGQRASASSFTIGSSASAGISIEGQIWTADLDRSFFLAWVRR